MCTSQTLILSNPIFDAVHSLTTLHNMECYLPVGTLLEFWAILPSLEALDQQYRFVHRSERFICKGMAEPDHVIIPLQSFGSLITFAGTVLFSNNRNHPEGFSGVLHLAAFGQILLQRGVNMTFTNNSGA